jgi:hypothetical protein
MRNRIITLAAATLAAGAVSLAGMAGASASTHPIKNASITCGFNCFNLSNLQLDNQGSRGGFIQTAVGGFGGTSINLRGAGNSKLNEDFVAAVPTDVFNACGVGLLAPASIFCINPGQFSGDPVVEANFAPGGRQTGVCIANQVANVAGRLALAPCGVSALTTWVFDSANISIRANGRFYSAFLNGADTNFSHPLALTVNPSSKTPKNVLRTDQENPAGGNPIPVPLLPDTQLFTFSFGPTSF